jgi:hypothetical protein
MGSRDHAPTSVWFDDAQEGTFDLTMSAIVSTLLDPSDYFNAWYRKSRRNIIRAGSTRASKRWSTKSTGNSMQPSAKP